MDNFEGDGSGRGTFSRSKALSKTRKDQMSSFHDDPDGYDANDDSKIDHRMHFDHSGEQFNFAEVHRVGLICSPECNATLAGYYHNLPWHNNKGSKSNKSSKNLFSDVGGTPWTSSMIEEEERELGKWMLTGAAEEVLVWRVKSGQLVARWRDGSCDDPAKVQVTRILSLPPRQPGSRTFAVGYTDGSIRLWTLTAKQHQEGSDRDKGRVEWDWTGAGVQCILHGHTSAVTCLAESNHVASLHAKTFTDSLPADGPYGVSFVLASGSKDTDIVVWDCVGECGRARLSGHTNAVTSLAFLTPTNSENNDGNSDGLLYLASASKDSLVKIWECSTLMASVLTCVEHRGEVLALSYMPSLPILTKPEELTERKELTKSKGKDDDGEDGKQEDSDKNTSTKPAVIRHLPILVTAGADREIRFFHLDCNNTNCSLALNLIGTWTRAGKDRALHLALTPFLDVPTKREPLHVSYLLTCSAADKTVECVEWRDGPSQLHKHTKHAKRVAKRTKTKPKNGTKKKEEEEKAEEQEKEENKVTNCTGASSLEWTEWALELAQLVRCPAKLASTQVTLGTLQVNADKDEGGGDLGVAIRLLMSLNNNTLHEAHLHKTNSSSAINSSSAWTWTLAEQHQGVQDSINRAGHRGECRVVAVASLYKSALPDENGNNDRRARDDPTLWASCSVDLLKIWEGDACRLTLTSQKLLLDQDEEEDTFSIGGGGHPVAMAFLGENDRYLCVTWSVDKKSDPKNSSFGNKLVLIETSSGRIVARQVCKHDTITASSAYYNADAGTMHVVTCGSDKNVHFWLIKRANSKANAKAIQEDNNGDEHKDDGVEWMRFKHTKTLQLPDEACAARWSSDGGKLLALALLDMTVKVFHVDTLKLAHNLYGHKLPVTCLDFSYGSSDSSVSHGSKGTVLLLTGGPDKMVRAWAMDFGDCRRALHAHTEPITQVRWLRGGSGYDFVTCGRDGWFKQWTARGWQLMQQVRLSVSPLCAMEVGGLPGVFFGLPATNTVAIAGTDKTLRVLCPDRSGSALHPQEVRESQAAMLAAMYTAQDQDQKTHQTAKKFSNDDDDKLIHVGAERATQSSKRASDNLFEAIAAADEYRAALEEYKRDPSTPIPHPGPLFLAYRITPNSPISENGEIVSSNDDVIRPYQVVLKVLSQIAAAEVDPAILALPFSYVRSLLVYLRDALRYGECLSIFIIHRCVTAIMRAFHGQLTAACALSTTTTSASSTYIIKNVMDKNNNQDEDADDGDLRGVLGEIRDRQRALLQEARALILSNSIKMESIVKEHRAAKTTAFYERIVTKQSAA